MYLFIYLSVYSSICLSVYLSVCLSVYLSIYIPKNTSFEKELQSAKLGGIRTGAKIGFAAGGLNMFYSCFSLSVHFFGKGC